MSLINRCPWCIANPLLLEYHDREWGVPVTDDRVQFEFMVLESFQAGLSWLTILKKRENFLKAFEGFDPGKVARFGPEKVRELLSDEGIIRNRQKVSAAISNARAFIDLVEKEGSFSSWLWGFVDGEPIVGGWSTEKQIPAETPLSKKVSRELNSRGFSFLGPIVVYSHMQAVGLVNDHLTGCFRYKEVSLCSSMFSSIERSSTPASDSI